MSIYTPTVWKNGAPPAINGANLNKLEAGVKSAHTEIDDIIDGTVTVSKADSATTATNVTGQIPISTKFKIGGVKMDVRLEDDGTGTGTDINNLYIDTSGY